MFIYAFRFLVLTTGALSASVLVPRDQTITQSSRNPTYNANFGRTGELATVNPGVTVWLSGGSTHNFLGNLDNYGSITVSQTDYLTQNRFAGGQSSYFLANGANGGNLINRAGAFISLNDYGSASAPSYYWNLQTMSNAGGIQFCGRGDTGGSTYWLTTRKSSTNNGLIDFGQYSRNLGAAFYWRNYVAGDDTTMTNEGAVRLSNVVFHNTQNIYGSGCWILNSGSVLYLEDGTGVAKNPSRGPSFPGQKIYFAQDDSTIHMDTAVYSRASNFGADVYGFGKGKAIEFYQTIRSYSYSNGVLSVNFGTYSVNIRIGGGYSPNLFRQGRNSEHYGIYNAIFYDGSAPSQNIPGVCSVSQRTCADPATTVGVTSSTTTTTTAATTTSTVSLSTTTTPATTSTTTTTTTSETTTSTTSPTTTTTTTPSPTTTPPTTTSVDVTSSSTSSTTTTSVVPTPICGIAGYDLQNPAAFSASSTDGSSYAACKAFCSSQTSKITQSIAVGGGQCLCYDAPVQGNLNAVPSSPYIFYDLSCPPPPEITTTTPTSTEVASSTTTTVPASSATGLCANGAGPSSTYQAKNGDVYGVCKNTDFPAGDLSNVSDVQSVEDCGELCSQTSACIAATFHLDSRICYLKKDRNPADAHEGDDSVYKIASAN